MWDDINLCNCILHLIDFQSSKPSLEFSMTIYTNYITFDIWYFIKTDIFVSYDFDASVYTLWLCWRHINPSLGLCVLILTWPNSKPFKSVWNMPLVIDLLAFLSHFILLSMVHKKERNLELNKSIMCQMVAQD